MSKIHDLKCWPEYFQAIKRGEKTFEIRLDDRDYQVGDTLHQREWCPVSEKYSGDELSMEVTYKMEGGKFGLPESHCILGFKSPAMAEEIKRLRHSEETLSRENNSLSQRFEILHAEKSRVDSEIVAIRRASSERITKLESLRRTPATREDRAFQCLQGLLAANDQTPHLWANTSIYEAAIYHAERMLAALAKPQAQETSGLLDESGVMKGATDRTALPAGCEPFDLERAKVEGARDADGVNWKWRTESFYNTNEQCVFTSENDDTYWFDAFGRPIADAPKRINNLYCIAKPVTRRPFNLEAALRGEKVVTSGGVPALGFEKLSGVKESEQFQYRASIGGLEEVFTAEGLPGSGSANDNLFMEASV